MTAPSFKLGLNGVIQRNTGSYGSPVWVAINNVDDVDMPVEMEEADATNRASGGFGMIIPSIMNISVETNMKYDTTDTQWSALQSAFFGRTLTEFAITDEPIATTGAQGMRASFYITKWGRSEKLKEIMVTPITLKPGPSANNPAWVTT